MWKEGFGAYRMTQERETEIRKLVDFTQTPYPYEPDLIRAIDELLEDIRISVLSDVERAVDAAHERFVP